MVHVHHDRIHQHVKVMLVVYLHIADKIIEIEEPGQMIPLRGLNDFPALGKFDALVDPRADDFPHGIRLRYEIRRPIMKALHFSALIRSQYDHRDGLKFLIGLHGGEDFKAAHARHIQVKQDQCQVVPVLPDLLHGFHSVRRIDHIVSIFENIGEHHPVNFLILHDEDLPAHIDDRFFLPAFCKG